MAPGGVRICARLGLAAPADALEPTFARTLYQQPSVTDHVDGSTTIDVNAPAAGVYYHVGLDPNKVHRVTVDGETTAGDSFTLRRRSDSDAPVYLNAPEGTDSFRVTGASHFELLFYCPER